MAYTVQDLERVERALATGALSIESEGKRVTYRSQRELVQLAATIRAELGIAPGAPVRLIYAETDKDLGRGVP